MFAGKFGLDTPRGEADIRGRPSTCRGRGLSQRIASAMCESGSIVSWTCVVVEGADVRSGAGRETVVRSCDDAEYVRRTEVTMEDSPPDSGGA